MAGLYRMGRKVAEIFLPYRRIIIVITHALMITTAYIGAFILRFDYPLHKNLEEILIANLLVLYPCKLLVFGYFGLYQGMWRYVSVRDLVTIVKANTVGSLMLFAGIFAINGYGFPRMVIAIDWILCILFLGGARTAIRLFRERRSRPAEEDATDTDPKEDRRAVVVGAGDAAAALLREMQGSSKVGHKVVGIVDDNPRLQGRGIHGVRVKGTVAQLPDLVGMLKADLIIVAVPSATPEQRRRIMEYCRRSQVPTKNVPSTRQFFQDQRIGQLETLHPEDLLERKPVHVNVHKLLNEIHGKRALVTGAGGSIGSELCRQLSLLDPELIVMYERAESSLYFTNLELTERFPEVKVVPVVGDIRDATKLDEVISAVAPDVIYHAAAYKHVPLMEDHPLEAIDNNIFGTRCVAEAALRGNVEKFVFISTDKAVQPQGVMGMTKRIAESLLCSMNATTPTTFVSVRFGNVLGSVGSVLPLFQWQIARGGPVTVTDPDATRYFMLVAEAAQLVLQAGSMGRGGEVFFLDMGEAIRIVDLAERVIRLSGYSPKDEMPLATVGMRAGERLTEQLVRETETLTLSDHERIYMTQGAEFNPAALREDLDSLKHLIDSRNHEAAVEHLRTMADRY